MEPVDAPRAVIGYHYPCKDGVLAALCVLLGITRSSADVPPAPDLATLIGRHGVRFLPLATYETVAARTERARALLRPADTLYLVDISVGPAFVTAACGLASKVVLIDHHKTGAEDLAALSAGGGAPPANLEAHFDMSRSAAGMARDHFGLRDAAAFAHIAAPGGAVVAGLNRLVDLVQDQDLFLKALPGSEDFASGLSALNLEMSAEKNARIFDDLLAVAAGDGRIDAIIAAGAAETKKMLAHVAERLGAAFPVAITFSPTAPPLRCLCVVTTEPDYRSTLGSHLAAASAAAGLADAAAILYTEAALGAEAATHWKMSLRAVAETDVSAVSKALGGGGHKLAASCIVSRELAETWREKKEEGAAAPS